MKKIGIECFRNEEAALRFIEARVWPNGPVCPHCGSVDRSGLMRGQSTRVGTYKCYGCRKPYTVKVGTIFEASHIPLHLWLRAIFLISTSRIPPTPYALHRLLGITPKSAASMADRLRALRSYSFERETMNGLSCGKK